jgi:hypothetical protein
MKILALFLVLISINVQAATLACWNKRDSSRQPVITATVVSKNKLTDLTDSDVNVAGTLIGKVNKKATKYKGYLYFVYSIGNTDVETILPPKFSETTGYFDAISRANSPEGGGTTYLRCRVN